MTLDARAQRIAIWCGPVGGLLAVIGVCALARWVPPWIGPSDPPEEVARVFTEHATRIRVGTFIGCFGFTLFAPWGLAVAAQVKRQNAPVITYLLAACTAVAMMFLVLTCCLWGTVVFRPDTLDPKVTRTLNDLAWIVFLFSAPPFTLWAGTLAYATLADDNAVYPRWIGYLSAWVALLIVPAGLVIFFKHGAFGYAGVLALYTPFVVFFVWLIALTRCTLTNLQEPHV